MVAGALALAGCQGPGLGGGAGAQQAAPIQVSYAGNGAIEVVSTDRAAITQVEVISPSGPIPSTMSVHRETVDPYADQYASPPPVMSPYVGGGIGVGVGIGRWGGGTRTGSGLFFGSPLGYRRGFHGAPWGAPGPYAGYGSAPPPSGGVMRSTARVTFDDPAAYERQWHSSTVRVRLGDGPDAPVTELPAPSPRR